MKNYFVIGNPVEHSISPDIHNRWLNESNIQAVYHKKTLNSDELENFVNEIRKKKISGANITVPYKEKIIRFMDILTDSAKEANSVNTIYLIDRKIIGDNTDIKGFYFSLKGKNINFNNQSALVLGSGGVTASIIIGLKKLGVDKIFVSNRTRKKAEDLKKRFNFLEILEWEEKKKTNIVINTTRLGLKTTDKNNLNYNIFEPETLFYDVIYSPKETNFLKRAKEQTCKTQNGMMMFVYQAAEAFKIWHNVEPKIDDNLIKSLQND